MLKEFRWVDYNISTDNTGDGSWMGCLSSPNNSSSCSRIFPNFEPKKYAEEIKQANCRQIYANLMVSRT